MMGRRPSPRVYGAILALLALLAACGPERADELSSTRALAATLGKAGATVQETAILAPDVFTAQSAQVLQVNDGLVYVYEYATGEQARGIAARISTEGVGFLGDDLPWEGRVSCWQVGQLLVVYPGTDGGLLLLLSGLLGDPLSAPLAGPEEPYPPAVAAAIAAWAAAQGADPTGVEVVGYTTAEWSNGCLGLPKPGEICAPGEVSGWIVDLKAGDQIGSAHTDDLGLQVRLAPFAGG